MSLLVKWSTQGFLLAAAVSTVSVNAGPLEQAKRLHERITGVSPSADTNVLDSMATAVAAGNARGAAFMAMDHDAFYNVTLVNWAAPWTNRDQSVFEPLNDYIATVVGFARDDRDFREILSADVLYHAPTVTPSYQTNSNAHYEAISSRGLSLQQVLAPESQASLSGLPSDATAGVITSRAAAKAFFKAGTNRAQLRFTLLNHLCHDLEQLHDITRAPDRIRQDVSRSPGGDSRAFLNGCLGCHSGMDPLAQAFAYYDYMYDADNDLEGIDGFIDYNEPGDIDPDTGTRVKAKYHINSATFKYGFATPDDSWDNYWRQGVNTSLGWSESLPAGSGNGAKSLGQELAQSEAFASCQAQKVFKNQCFREPENQRDRVALAQMITNFKASGYTVKSLFADAAVHCVTDIEEVAP